MHRCIDNAQSLTSAPDDIRRHFVIFQGLIQQAEDSVAAGQLGAGAAYAQIAADFAWHNHPGLFASPRLERLIAAVSEKITCDDDNQHAVLPGSVLHVLTQAYDVGGSTRFVWRWMCHDRARHHSVALSRQEEGRIPDPLVMAAHNSGGSVHLLDARSGDLIARALRLRRLAQSAECVVLHTHPYDVVPGLAFAQGDRCPPTIYVNHADHLFGVVTQFPDVVVHIRQSGQDLSLTRRGIDETRCTLLPIPLPQINRTQSRAEAKAQLGFPVSAVLLLSIASGYKYEKMHDVGFLDAILPVLDKHPDVVAAIVGPKCRGDWARAAESYADRLRIVEQTPDTKPYYEAADIYLDSFPFSSLTSLLEAGSYGTPLLCYRGHPDAAAVLCADDLAFANEYTHIADLARYHRTLSDLITNRQRREAEGARVQRDIERIHTGEAWIGALSATYAQALSHVPRQRQSELNDRMETDQLDCYVAQFQVSSNLCRPLRNVVRSSVGLLPPGSRFSFWVTNAISSPHIVLSEHLRSRIRHLISRYSPCTQQ